MFDYTCPFHVNRAQYEFLHFSNYYAITLRLNILELKVLDIQNSSYSDTLVRVVEATLTRYTVRCTVGR